MKSAGIRSRFTRHNCSGLSASQAKPVGDRAEGDHELCVKSRVWKERNLEPNPFRSDIIRTRRRSDDKMTTVSERHLASPSALSSIVLDASLQPLLSRNREKSLLQPTVQAEIDMPSTCNAACLDCVTLPIPLFNIVGIPTNVAGPLLQKPRACGRTKIRSAK